MALSRCVSDVTLQTRTFWNMIENITDGIDSAGSRARVFALGIDAGQAGRAISVEDALGSAGQVGVTEKPWQTFAGGCSAKLGAFGVVSTRGWVAGADLWFRGRCGWKKI